MIKPEILIPEIEKFFKTIDRVGDYLRHNDQEKSEGGKPMATDIELDFNRDYRESFKLWSDLDRVVSKMRAVNNKYQKL